MAERDLRELVEYRAILQEQKKTKPPLEDVISKHFDSGVSKILLRYKAVS